MGIERVNTTERLTKLRELMGRDENGVQAYVVPSEDQHGSEYIAACDERRAFISGFTGSAGLAIVTKDKALLFTDGRYFLQAGKQLDDNWTLMKQGIKDVPTWQDYLAKNLEPSKIGIDSTVFPAEEATKLATTLKPRGSQLVPLKQNLVDEVWGSDRPARTKNLVFALAQKYTGESHTSKLARVRDELKKADAAGIVLTALDEIAWFFNLRGSDIAYNPVFFAYAIVTLDSETLFIQRDSAPVPDIAGDFASETEVRPYEEFWERLREVKDGLGLGENKKLIISDKASLAVADAIGEGNYTAVTSPVTLMKSIKNDTELEGFRQAHIRDGVALVRYFAWLQNELEQGNTWNEWDAAGKLEALRGEEDHFKGLSFDTISSTGPNGAIIHYSPSQTESAVIKREQIYLCDSGAQYLDGTTDVTRTWHFGEPTNQEKNAFTAVLKGHIAIDKLVYPNDTTGMILDAFARRALWKEGLDYRHGTGHGVGAFLNVHEGPHMIGTRISANAHAMRAGMTVSNEPGYYEDGKFGIRIESIVLVRDAQTPHNFGDKGFLRMENVTMCPIHTKLVVKESLSVDEVKWLNDYHALVFKTLSPLLRDKDANALAWLEKECKAI